MEVASWVKECHNRWRFVLELCSQQCIDPGLLHREADEGELVRMSWSAFEDALRLFSMLSSEQTKSSTTGHLVKVRYVVRQPAASHRAADITIIETPQPTCTQQTQRMVPPSDAEEQVIRQSEDCWWVTLLQAPPTIVVHLWFRLTNVIAVH